MTPLRTPRLILRNWRESYRPAKYRGAGIVTMLAVIVSVLPANAAIGGRYCGLAWSNGKMVDVVTTLTTSADGLLVGSYEFEDGGRMTQGTLAEYWRMPRFGTRTLIWTDIYGRGQVTWRFFDDGDSFEGHWQVGLDIPDLPWTGRRCDATA